jgi:hypothetical protein
LSQRVGLIGVDLHPQDSRELAGEVGHATLNPVAPMLGDHAGERLNETRAIRAEDGEDEGCLAHGSTQPTNR